MEREVVSKRLRVIVSAIYAVINAITIVSILLSRIAIPIPIAIALMIALIVGYFALGYSLIFT